MPNATLRANARTLSSATTRRAALTALASAPALAVPSALVAAGATASLASISPELSAAIDAHRLAQANVDAQSSEQEEEFNALCDFEGEAWWKLAETPCGTDADLITKIAYLLRHEQRLWGEALHTRDGQYGALAFAVDLHLEERDEWRAFSANAAGQSA